VENYLPVFVRYMRRETDAAEVLDSASSAMVFIDTSGDEKGEGGWNECVLQGLIQMLAVVVAQVHFIDSDDCFRVKRNFRIMQPLSVIAPRRSDARETAEMLLAYVELLFGAPNEESRRDSLDPQFSSGTRRPTPLTSVIVSGTCSWLIHLCMTS